MPRTNAGYRQKHSRAKAVAPCDLTAGRPAVGLHPWLTRPFQLLTMGRCCGGVAGPQCRHGSELKQNTGEGASSGMHERAVPACRLPLCDLRTCETLQTVIFFRILCDSLRLRDLSRSSIRGVQTPRIHQSVRPRVGQGSTARRNSPSTETVSKP